jgi:hypothetical protein
MCLRDLKQEAKRQRVFPDPVKYSPDTPGNVPDGLKDMLDNIQKLGKTELRENTAVSASACDKPWRFKNMQKAKIIVDFAVKCKRECQNEAGWRNDIETRLMERFDFEVAWLVFRSST